MPSAHHEPWDLTEEERARYRRISNASREAKSAAMRGDGPEPIHPVNTPALDALNLMPECADHGLAALSLFSGGGGLDLGFQRAGFQHLASYEILQEAADTLTKANPDWVVCGGEDGDVCQVDWRPYRGHVAVLHGGPPCQPFSAAGRQRGSHDARDMFPEFVRAVRESKPDAFVAENVPALLSKKFAHYVRQEILEPLSREYEVRQFVLRAEDYGIPQVRRRVVFVGFRNKLHANRFRIPPATHAPFEGNVPGLPTCPGAREALGLPDLGKDALAPTIRSALTGPRHTTSVISSVSAARKWAEIEIWPNGVAPSREKARAFVANNGHFRLSTLDCAVLQGFPESWPFQGATYMVLGQIGNAVPPPLGYAVAKSVADAIRGV